MAFNLEITIAGICLLVRDTRLNQLHVLMPPTGIHVHRAILAYSKEHEGGSPTAVEKRELAGKQLDLTELSSSNGFSLAMPADVFDFGGPPLGPREVDRVFLDGATLPAGLRSRTSLAAGHHGAHQRGGVWFVRDENGVEISHRMATSVAWRLEDVPLPNLVLDLGGGQQHTLTPLPGPDGKDRIQLLLLHVTQEELDRLTGPILGPATTTPQNRHPAHHFTTYFQLLDPVDPVVTPEFDLAGFNRGGGLASATPSTSAALNFGSELTCMVTTAPGQS